MPIDDQEKKLQLVKLVRDAIERDDALREKYQMGNKFRFIRERLHELLERLEKHAHLVVGEVKKSTFNLAEDEALVYVYLFNAQGASLKSWANMLTANVFYEYSVNRPIYAEKSHIDALLKSKSNKSQHAFLTVIIKRSDITKPISENSLKDIVGSPLIKVKEGALRFDKLVTFTHSGHIYKVDENGELIP